MSARRILVLGGEFAGLWSAVGAARKLDELGHGPDAVEVTLVKCDARFKGAYRVDVEDVPRLPPFPAAWTLSDPRGRPYFVFWTLPLGDNLAYVLRMEAVEQGAAVQLTIPDVGVFRIPIVRRSLPRRGGFAILYRCPGCARPRRYLYLRSLAFGRFVAYQGPLCEACAGLRWASQGRFIWTLARTLRLRLGLHPSARLPIPRHPWDPRAVSLPRLILDEFPDLVRA